MAKAGLVLPPTAEATPHALSLSYHAAMSQAMMPGLSLEVALIVENGNDFAAWETRFRLLYSMVCVIKKELDVNTDVSFVPVDSSLAILTDWMTRRRPWTAMYVLQSLSSWVPSCAAAADIEPMLVPGHGLSGWEQLASASASHPHRCRTVAVGGTFDHLHEGHKLLLTMTVMALDSSSGGCINIGISGSQLLKNKQFAEELESWEDRQKATHDFVLKILSSRIPPSTPLLVESSFKEGGRLVKVTCTHGLCVRYVELQDPSGPTVSNPDIDALIISAETRSGGDAINRKRVDRGWRPLKILQVGVIDAFPASDPAMSAIKLSSTAIREALYQKKSEHSGTDCHD